MNELSSTAEDILRKTRPIILTGGYDGFSYADIAQVVGIRKASIHHHFPTKAELVRTLVARYRQEALDGLLAMDRTIESPAARLQAYVDYWQSCLTTGSEPFCVCALLASQMPALPEEVALEVRGHFKALSGWLSAVLADGAGRGRLQLIDTPEVEAEVFMATVHGAMLSARAASNPDLFETIVRPLLRRLIA